MGEGKGRHAPHSSNEAQRVAADGEFHVVLIATVAAADASRTVCHSFRGAAVGAGIGALGPQVRLKGGRVFLITAGHGG